MRHPDFALDLADATSRAVPKLDRAAACRGASALLSALDVIGGPGNDSDMAAIICAEELTLRELVRFALVKLASEGQQ